MSRVTPALSAAAARLATPSLLMRSFSRQALRNIIFHAADGMCVARLMMQSWPATARLSDSTSNRSATTLLAPAGVPRATPPGLTPAVTECPWASRRGTTRRPITPVAPLTKIRMRQVPLRRGSAVNGVMTGLAQPIERSRHRRGRLPLSLMPTVVGQRTLTYNPAVPRVNDCSIENRHGRTARPASPLGPDQGADPQGRAPAVLGRRL